MCIWSAIFISKDRDYDFELIRSEQGTVHPALAGVFLVHSEEFSAPLKG